MRLSICAIAALAITGCAEQRRYIYAPQPTNTVAAGMPASRTLIPPEQPEGAVEVTSYGTTQLTQGDARVPALHARLVVTNDGDDRPWQIDTRQQMVEIAGEGRSAPMFANSDAKTLPIITVARHDRRVVDLYYPLPPMMTDDTQLPRFELQWQVTTPAREVASRTEFDRVERQTQLSYYESSGYPLWAGYGPYWWYDPLSPSLVFVHTRPIAIRDHRAPVRIGRFGGHFRATGARISRGGRHR